VSLHKSMLNVLLDAKTRAGVEHQTGTAGFMQPEDDPELLAAIPKELPILPLPNRVAYPLSVLPLAVVNPRSVKMIEEALEGNRVIGLLAGKDSSINVPLPGQVYEVGTVAKIYHVMRTPNNTLRLVVHCLERSRVKQWLYTEPYLRARIELIPDILDSDLELDALRRTLQELVGEIVALSSDVPKEAGDLLNNIKDPRHLGYMVATCVPLELPDGQKILEMDKVKDKLRILISHLLHESNSRPFKRSWVKQMKRCWLHSNIQKS